MPFLRKSRFWLATIVVSVAYALAVMPQIALSSEGISIPSYAVRVGGGKLNHGFWAVLVFGTNQGKRCWGTKGINHGLKSEGVFCGLEVPPKKFQLVARGASTRRHHRASVSIYIVRKDVERLRVLVRERGAQTRWLTVRSQLIDGNAATKAHLHPTVGYVKVVAKSGSSVARVVAITRE